MLTLLRVAALTALLVGCTSPGAGEGDVPPQPTRPTPLEALDLTALPVARAPFCRALDGAAVSEALRGPVTGTRHYGNGDRAELVPGYVDVSHEYNCTFEGASATARAWVFAKPVDRVEADGLVEQTRRQDRCSFPDGLGFGDPSVTEICPTDGGMRVALHGLFGDAWLSCEVTAEATTASAEDTQRRAERWCVDVVTSLGAQP